jgi:hypothetical protein
VFADLPLLSILYPTEVVVDDARAKRNGATVQRLAWTTKDVVTVQGKNVSFHPSRELMGAGATSQGEAHHEVTLAVTVSGAIGSAFGAKAASNSARLLVVSSGAFLSNPFADAAGDETLTRYAEIYKGEHAGALLTAKRACDWMLRLDEQIEP